MNIEQRLFALQDLKYRDFHKGLVPGMPDDYIIGVRMPELRKLAKEVDVATLFAELPHRYYEENQLHAIVLSAMKDYDACMAEVKRFLQYINNWATCDGLRPRCFAKHGMEVLDNVRRWISAEHEYTVRFGIGVLEAFYLDDKFDVEQLLWVAAIEREEYYIRMAIAWLVAECFIKYPEATLVCMKASKLPKWTFNKTISKICDSRRVDEETKKMLTKLRR